MTRTASFARAGIIFVFAVVVLGPSAAIAADAMKITVGYQPYDTISYSAVVIRGLELWKKHLPKNVEVQFESALQGAIIVNAMVADKQQIGYLGDMPAVVSTTKIKQAPVKLVANTGYSAGQRCNVVMVRTDAPQFKTPEEAVKWLDGKVVATPKGSCADRFLRQMVAKTGIKPKEVLNQSIEVITTNFRTKRIDAAVLWEPTVSRIGDFVGEGVAREVATGYNFDIPDAGFIAMREDFIKKSPDIVKAWLATELEAQQYLLDPAHWDKVAEMVRDQTNGITVPMAWFSIYGAVPAARGGSPIRDTKPYIFTDEVRKEIASTYAFLHEVKVIDVGEAPPGAIDDSIAREILKTKGAPTPLGIVKPLPASDAPKK
ncbi:MAG TPA: ABC transporter substrate-binding protein [Casimicrobiaceae bacterium]